MDLNKGKYEKFLYVHEIFISIKILEKTIFIQSGKSIIEKCL